MKGVICCLTLLLLYCTLSEAHRRSHKHIRNPFRWQSRRNVVRIRATDKRDYVNLHLAEVVEMTDVVSDTTNMRTSVDQVRAQMKTMRSDQCVAADKYRSIDASCNNLYNPEWGTPMRKQLRLLPAQYDDDVGKPRVFRKQATPLPSSRVVSEACFPHDDATTLDDIFSNMMMQWGQFLDHDITGTPESETCFPHDDATTLDDIFSNMMMQWGQFLDHDITGTPESETHGDCCMGIRADGTHPNYDTNGDCFPIPISNTDRHFTTTNCMPFSRSAVAEESETREQMNIITPYLDASQIYGSSPQELLETREFRDGLLKKSPEDLLIMDANITRPCVQEDSGACFFSGDVRVNEFPTLSSMHVVFHREHNRLARELKILNPLWDDDTLFEEARKIVAAYMQVITYEEFLPITMGRGGMKRYQLSTKYRYDSETNPEIINSFSTAAYRFGHSMIRDTYQTLMNPNQDMHTMFFRPSFNLADNGTGYHHLIAGLLNAPCQRSDKFFSPGVSDKLFQDIPAPGASFDLGARNIQRGRDHGLPGYMEYRRLVDQKYNNPVAKDTSGYLGRLGERFHGRYRTSGGTRMPPRRRFQRYRGKRQADNPAELSAQCLQAYGNNYEDVDLFVGGMSEPHVDGGILGKTFAYIIGLQFHRLKHSDRFWYETSNSRIGFNKAQQNALKKVPLSRILCDNTNIPHIQKDVFRIPGQGNSPVACSGHIIPRLNLSLWKESANAGYHQYPRSG